MTTEFLSQFKKLNDLFYRDGGQIRRQFVLSSLLIMIFEQFKDYVIDRVDGFFSEHMEVKEGRITYTRGREFKDIMKEKGAGQPGQHANKAFRAALHWFYELNALDNDELDEIERLYILRNDIGHELFGIIADDAKPPITLFDVIFIFSMYIKIVRWWVKEIEAPTDPEISEDEYNNTDWDAVESFEIIILRTIIEKSLLEDLEWIELRKVIPGNHNV